MPAGRAVLEVVVVGNSRVSTRRRVAFTVADLPVLQFPCVLRVIWHQLAAFHHSLPRCAADGAAAVSRGAGEDAALYQLGRVGGEVRLTEGLGRYLPYRPGVATGERCWAVIR